MYLLPGGEAIELGVRFNWGNHAFGVGFGPKVLPRRHGRVSEALGVIISRPQQPTHLYRLHLVQQKANLLKSDHQLR